MKINFIDRIKKLLHQIEISIVEEDYDIVEINAQVLFNLVREKREEAIVNKAFLETKLKYYIDLTPRIKDCLESILELLKE